MNKKEALLIYIRNPEKGKVKKRLAASLGEDSAYKIYLKLLERTKKNVHQAGQDKVIFYSGFLDMDDIWENNIYQKKLQKGINIGQRMSMGFKWAFKEGYEKVVLIGSDIPRLNSKIIDLAFCLLNKKDIVLGPAKDGGYYLIGMKRQNPGVFDGIYWGTPVVFQQTLEKTQMNNLSYALLKELTDVDSPEDLGELSDNINQLINTC